MEQLTSLANFNSLIEMLNTLPDDKACREYLEAVIWKGTPTCPHCKSVNSYKLTYKGNFTGQYKCKACKKRYNVKDKTMFEGTHIGLKKWFIAIYIFSLHKKGISSYQLASDLGITQQSAWYLLGRIRMAFKPAPIRFKSEGSFQCDETFVGGKNKNRHMDKKVPESQGRSTKDKTVVFGIVQDGGNVHTTVIPDTKAKTIKPIITALISKGSIVATDEWKAYKGLSKDYAHITLNHKQHQYVSNGFHTNSIEGFWSQMKRGIYGIYHHVSPKHLHRYCDEFAFRYNVRKQSVSEKFNFSLENSIRLTYRELIAK